MKYIITEEQLNNTVTALNKENVNRGELGKAIEELVKYYVGDNLCDVVAIKVDTDFYVVIGLTSIFYPQSYRDKLANYVDNFFGTYPNIVFNDIKDCEKIKQD